PVCLKIRSGIPELVRQEETGILVTDRGENFVNAVKSLKNNPEFWKSLSEGARKMIRDEYGPEITVDSWRTMFEALATQQNYLGLNIQRRIKLPPVNKSIQGGDFRKQSFIKYIFLQIIRIIKFIMRNINVVHIKK
ncbi:glycosyltransferase, partial [candidate division KSB1 bacterium]|nr:glycosyltransferase [candidate division KSB1 bacterium]